MTCRNHLLATMRNIWVIGVGIVVFGLILNSCRDDNREIITIGIVAPVAFRTTVLEGFKEGMAGLDLVEGKDVFYIFDENLELQLEAVDEGINKLLAQKVDVLLTMGNMPTLQAKKAVRGTNVPVVFAAVSNPVGIGVVESIAHPGGNVTGIQVGLEVPKALEWIVKIVPNVQKVFVPFNPDDSVSVMFFNLLRPYAHQLNIELVPGEVHSVEEAVSAINNLPPDVQAIFRISSPTLDLENRELSRAAINRRLPLVAGHPLDEDVLLTLKSDLFDVGKRAARLVQEVVNGGAPADFPVETSEVTMAVNLKTARNIGLEIPDLVLQQADQVVQ